MSSYPDMVYGWCLPRIMHYVISLRLSLILISKYDYSNAYRRIAHSTQAATQTVAVNRDTAFVSLRLTYGGSPNPQPGAYSPNSSPTWPTRLPSARSGTQRAEKPSPVGYTRAHKTTLQRTHCDQQANGRPCTSSNNRRQG